jgi:porin
MFVLFVALQLQAPPQVPAHGQESEEFRKHDQSSSTIAPEDSGIASGILTEWARSRSWAAEHGVKVNLYLTVDSSSHMSGGANPHTGAVRGLFDAVFELDSEKALGWKGGTFLADLQVIDGDEGSSEVGVVQAYSNIDSADDRFQLARVWYEQSLWDGRSLLRIGKMDSNGQFAYTDTASHFINSSMGHSPNIVAMVSYPDPAFGASWIQQGPANTELRLGIYDGAAHEGYKTGARGPSTLFGPPSDLFMMGEVDLNWELSDERAGRMGVGVWKHTGKFDRFDGGTDDGTSGTYLTLDQRFNDNTSERGYSGFVMAALADEDVSSVATHLGVGVLATNVFAPHYQDALGFGITDAELSDRAGAGFTRDRETAFELFYGFEPIAGMRVKPDLQYIVNPGGNAAYDDALVFTLRLSMSL